MGRPVSLPRAGGMTVWAEPCSRSALWHTLGLYEHDRSQGPALFQGTVRQRNAQWMTFRNFLRQARAYDDAAVGVAGSSASLLYYYMAMNLAKAELMVSNPSSIMNSRIRHGLSFEPTQAQSVRGSYLTVRSGIFPLLYQKRVGKSLPSGTKLPISRLLAQVPEISSELVDALTLRPATMPLYSSTVSDDNAVWTLIAVFDRYGSLRKANHVTTRAILKHFELVATPSGWRDVFAISPRTEFGFGFTALEAKRKLHAKGKEDALRIMFRNSEARAMYDALSVYLDEPHASDAEAILCPSLYTSKSLPMPASLARYACMYYLSSLVRYKPQQLDVYQHGKEAWLLDTLASASSVYLISSAVSGILNKWHKYGSSQRV